MQHAPSHQGARSYVRGDVLAHEGRAGVVWRMDGAGLILLPVVRHNIPRHRGDVLLDADELTALGVAGRDMMVRCAHPVRRRADQAGTRVGAVPAALMLRLAVAFERAHQARRFEGAHSLRDDDARDAWR